MKLPFCEVRHLEELVSNINTILPLVPKSLGLSAVLTTLSVDGLLMESLTYAPRSECVLQDRQNNLS